MKSGPLRSWFFTVTFLFLDSAGRLFGDAVGRGLTRLPAGPIHFQDLDHHNVPGWVRPATSFRSLPHQSRHCQLRSYTSSRCGHVQPPLGCEVHGLGTIVAQIVSRVVAILVRDDEFAFVVDHSIHCDAELGFEITGGDQVSFVTKKLITVFRITGPDTYRSSRH